METPWATTTFALRSHCAPAGLIPFFLGDGAGLISTCGDSVGGGTSSVFFGLFPFSHRFPSSSLTSHAVFLKANVQMSETLFCLQAVSSTRTPWKRGANAVEARCERQERRANAVKTSCKLNGTPHRTPQNAVRTP